jgi:hypothetical protein
MTIRERNVDALAGAISRLVDAKIAGDQRVIGSHQNLTDAQTNLRDALRTALGMKIEDRADG